MTALRVVKPGLRSLIEDMGRPGFARLGIAASGAYDRGALLAANAAVGNPPQAAGIECVLGGLVLAAQGSCVVALAGTDAEGSGRPVELPNGETIAIARPRHGLRVYLAVAGGLAVQPVLGSRSRDTMSGIGPAQLREGDLLPVGTAATAGVQGPPIARTDIQQKRDLAAGHRVIEVVPGPHDDLLVKGIDGLFSESWIVSPQSDRVGLRLIDSHAHGTVPAANIRPGSSSLPSEPTLRGAVQVSPSGELLIIGPDGPTTGGYPVVAVVC